MWGLVALTYGLVIGTTLLAVASYYYVRSEVRPGDSADANPMRRLLVGSVWVPVYEGATFVEPLTTKENAVTTGSIKFHTKDPAGTVLAFYKDSLKEGGFVTMTTGNAGGTVQAVRRAGKTNVTVSVTSSSENTTGEIRTLNHEEPKQTSPVQ